MNIALPVNGRSTVLFRNGMNPDIIEALESQYKRSVEAVRPIAKQFQGRNEFDTARNVWNYLKYKCKYVKDDEGQQDIKLPGRFIRDGGNADCKSFSLFAAAIFGALGYETGFRYASYKQFNPTPSHVYCWIDVNGKKIICDGVYTSFNSEAPFKYKYDHPMKISVLSGVPGVDSSLNKYSLEQALLKMRPGGIYHCVVMNAIQRRDGIAKQHNYSEQQLQRYAKLLKYYRKAAVRHPFVVGLIDKELDLINGGIFTGDVWHYSDNHEIRSLQHNVGVEGIGGFNLRKLSFNNASKGLKHLSKQLSLKNAARALRVLAFMPSRKAFLALVSLNFRGLASRFKNHPASRRHMVRKWDSTFGGNTNTLEHAIDKGARKRPLLGGRIHGIGVVETAAAAASTGTTTTAASPHVVAGIITAAVPIVVAALSIFKQHNAPDVPGLEKDGEKLLQEVGGGDASGIIGKAEQFIKDNVGNVAATGVVPEPPMNEAEMIADKSIPESDYSEPFSFGGGGIMLPLAVLGVGVAVYAYSKNN